MITTNAPFNGKLDSRNFVKKKLADKEEELEDEDPFSCVYRLIMI